MPVEIKECQFVSRYRTETSFLVTIAGMKERVRVTLFDDPTADNNGFGPHKVRTERDANTPPNADEIAAAVTQFNANR